MEPKIEQNINVSLFQATDYCFFPKIGFKLFVAAVVITAILGGITVGYGIGFIVAALLYLKSNIAIGICIGFFILLGAIVGCGFAILAHKLCWGFNNLMCRIFGPF